MASPEIFPDFDVERDGEGNVIDWLGGTITIDFPQSDGSIRSFTYGIPAATLHKAAKENDVAPIVDYLAGYIATNWRRSVGQTAKARKGQMENARGYIERGLKEKVLAELQEIEEAREKEKPTVKSYVETVNRYIDDAKYNIKSMESQIADILVTPKERRTEEQKAELIKLDDGVRKENEFIRKYEREIKILTEEYEL